MVSCEWWYEESWDRFDEFLLIPEPIPEAHLVSIWVSIWNLTKFTKKILLAIVYLWFIHSNAFRRFVFFILLKFKFDSIHVIFQFFDLVGPLCLKTSEGAAERLEKGTRSFQFQKSGKSSQKHEWEYLLGNYCKTSRWIFRQNEIRWISNWYSS